MKLFKCMVGVVLLLTLLKSAQYINNTRTYKMDQISEFLAMCGTFIQTGFGSSKPGTWDYFLVLISAMMVLGSLWYSIKYLVHPTEQEGHIKFKILEE